MHCTHGAVCTHKHTIYKLKINLPVYFLSTYELIKICPVISVWKLSTRKNKSLGEQKFSLTGKTKCIHVYQNKFWQWYNVSKRRYELSMRCKRICRSLLVIRAERFTIRDPGTLRWLLSPSLLRWRNSTRQTHAPTRPPSPINTSCGGTCRHRLAREWRPACSNRRPKWWLSAIGVGQHRTSCSSRTLRNIHLPTPLLLASSANGGRST